MTTTFTQQKVITTNQDIVVVFDIKNYRIIKWEGSRLLNEVDLKTDPLSLSDYNDLLTK